ncbi:hypothetical protein ACA910_002755 [Epithemia clementina (nom. ined.)]
MKQSVSTTSRRLVQTVAHRAQVDWSKPYWTITPQVAAYYNSFKSWVAMADAEAEKYAAPPPPIDFSAAKQKVKDKELVDILESFYTSNKPSPETYEWPEDDKQHTDNHLAFVREQCALNDEILPVMEKEVAYLKKTRTTADTNMLDVFMKYPSMHEEVLDEIEERRWFKDTEFETKEQSGH